MKDETIQLQHKIRRFYDDSSGLWEEVWGEHMHHGYYGPDGQEKKAHYQAQIDLIDELLAWGRVQQAGRILDLGCGIGGSALLLAERYDAEVVGITLSPVQAERARQRAAAAGLAQQTRFEVADALAPPFAPGSFDLVWSMESGEHMPDKQRFLAAGYEMLSAGGKFLMATWCHRPSPPALTGPEQRLLQQMYRDYHLPYIVSLPQYQMIAAEVGFSEVQVADWTPAVAPFWTAVLRSALNLRSIVGLLRAGRSTIVGALAMRHMIRGYRSGLIRFGLLQGVRT